MAEVFVNNKNVNTEIAAEAPGHVFAAGTEPWLGRSGALDFLRLVAYHQVKQMRGLLDRYLMI